MKLLAMLLLVLLLSGCVTHDGQTAKQWADDYYELEDCLYYNRDIGSSDDLARYCL